MVPKEKVLSLALEYAKIIASNAPDAVRSTKQALLLAKEHGMWESSTRHYESPENKQFFEGENIQVRLNLALS